MHGWAIWQKYHVTIVLEISQFNYFITILCHVGFTIVSEQCSQNNFPITKTNPFKVTKYKNYGWYLDQSGRRLKSLSLFYLLLKIRKKLHITNTHTIQIKQTVLYFQEFQENSRNWINKYKNKTLYRLIPIKAAVLFFMSRVEFFSVFCCFSINNFVDSVIVFNIYTII